MENLNVVDFKSKAKFAVVGNVVKEQKIENYNDVELKAAPEKIESNIQSLSELKENIKELSELHSRLRFMLNELEGYVSKK